MNAAIVSLSLQRHGVLSADEALFVLAARSHSRRADGGRAETGAPRLRCRSAVAVNPETVAATLKLAGRRGPRQHKMDDRLFADDAVSLIELRCRSFLKADSLFRNDI